MSSDIPVKLVPPTPMVEKDSIPFPKTESQPTVAVSAVHVTAGPSTITESVTHSTSGGGGVAEQQTAQERSQHSSSSGTAGSESDQLTSLPVPPTASGSPGPPPRRFRPSTSGSNASSNRFRRSLDAVSASLLSISSSPITRSPQVQHHSSPLIYSTRACASERSSPVRSTSPRSILSTRGTRVSDPQLPGLFTTPVKSLVSSRSPSQSRSRATSPLRRLHQWSSHLHHRRGGQPPAEEPFVPIDPFKLKSTFPSLPCFPSHRARGQRADIEAQQGTPEADCDLLPQSSMENLYIIMTDTLPRQIYLNILLRLPAMYFSRVARIFEDAEVSKPDIVRMMEGGRRDGAFFKLPTPPQAQQPSSLSSPAAQFQYPPGSQFTHQPQVQPHRPGSTGVGIGLMAHVGTAAAVGGSLPMEDWSSASVSPALFRFKQSWEAFVDSLLREWKTLNLTSALLASGILTTFQVPEMADDPVTKTAALLSLICAIMSLSYGCIFILRFGTMRSLYKASKWAEEARKDYTLIWWNVWVLLAMPTVWLAWSMLFFLVSILSYVWRTGSISDPEHREALGTKVILGPRVAITVILGLGLVYMAMIIKTLRRYGSDAGVRGILSARAGSPPAASPSTGNRGVMWSPGEEANRGRERERRVRERTDRSGTTRREVERTLRRTAGDEASEKNLVQ